MSLYFSGWDQYFIGWGTADVPSIPQGGAGGPSVYWQGKQRPEKRAASIDEIFAKVLEEHYGEIVASAPKEIKREAAKLVRPFADTKRKTPEPSKVDWKAMEFDLVAARALVSLWQQHDDDEEVMALYVAHFH